MSLVTKRELLELTAKLHPEADVPEETRLLLTGLVCGTAVHLRDQLEEARAECAALREALEAWQVDAELFNPHRAHALAKEALSSSALGAEYAEKVRQLLVAAGMAVGSLRDGLRVKERLQEALNAWSW